MTPSNHRGPGRHRLNHDQPKRLRPVDWEQESQGIPEKTTLFVLVDLANELNKRMVEQGPNHLLEIVLVGLIHLGGDLERNSGTLRDLDGAVGALLWGNPAQKREVITPLRVKRAH